MSWGLCHLPSALMKKWLKEERLLYFCLRFLRRGVSLSQQRSHGSRSMKQSGSRESSSSYPQTGSREAEWEHTSSKNASPPEGSLTFLTAPLLKFKHMTPPGKHFMLKLQQLGAWDRLGIQQKWGEISGDLCLKISSSEDKTENQVFQEGCFIVYQRFQPMIQPRNYQSYKY